MPRVLYAIQGCGNGHLTRALDIIPLLQARVERLDVLISGPASDMPFPYPVRYRCQGLSYVMDRRGGLSFTKTFLQLRLLTLVREIRQVPVRDYDLVISDYEPVTAWACRLRGRPCVSLSHQSGVLSRWAPRPQEDDRLGRTVLQNYAPATEHYGFHFQRYEPNVFTPVIRQQVRALRPTNEGHYTVYLPAFDEETLVQSLQKLNPNVRWEVFSKFSRQAVTRGKVRIMPVSADAFLDSMARSAGVLCGAGFETPAEALFLGKKVCVIPMKDQYEQACNAAAIAQLGVPVAHSLAGADAVLLRHWLDHGRPVAVDYPDETAAIIDRVLQEQTSLVTTPAFIHRVAA
jgi:uncharacterized protein (TIGR00661 family)